ncbi:MAG: hypothetical protein KDI36_12385, partial [Pseudomonadales bacterium]|nr:hypothetical protein [Pseudomonadales bacterium]
RGYLCDAGNRCFADQSVKLAGLRAQRVRLFLSWVAGQQTHRPSIRPPTRGYSARKSEIHFS